MSIRALILALIVCGCASAPPPKPAAPRIAQNAESARGLLVQVCLPFVRGGDKDAIVKSRAISGRLGFGKLFKADPPRGERYGSPYRGVQDVWLIDTPARECTVTIEGSNTTQIVAGFDAAIPNLTRWLRMPNAENRWQYCALDEDILYATSSAEGKTTAHLTKLAPGTCQRTAQAAR